MEYVDVLKKDGSREALPVYNIHDFPYEQLRTISQKTRNKKPVSYLCEFMTFDIETTTVIPPKDKDGKYKFTPTAFMWHWQACVGGFLVFGRFWEEFFEFIKTLQIWLKFKRGEKHFVCYVHNLGYELGFLYPFFEEYFGGEYEVFATGSHHPIRVTCGNGLEFRCSYKLSNMSLYYATTTEIGVQHPKAYGDLDYKKFRTAKSPVTMTEKGYNASDVLSLYEYIKSVLAHNKDTLETIPMTSTGYPRRDCRRAARSDDRYRDKVFKKCELNASVYVLLKEAGRGGDTHASRFMSGRIWHDFYSLDAVSDYPFQLCAFAEYPISKYSPYGEIESQEELNSLLEKYCCLFRVTFEGLRIRPREPMPYIPKSKCRDIPKGAVYDNGRIMSIPKGAIISMTVCDIDYAIIKDCYEWDSMIITDFHIADKGYLPQCLRDQIMKYFAEKCRLKYELGKLKKRQEAGEDVQDEYNKLDYLYGKIKNKLNGIFGMMYMDPCHIVYKMDSAGEWTEEAPDIDKALSKYNNSRNSFLVYAWGSRCTALARLHLRRIQKCFDYVAYSDTDSAKGAGVHWDELEKLNQWIIGICEESKVYWDDPEGQRYYMGVFENETPEPYKDFKTLGAKKYAYVDSKGLLHCTVSGVSAAKKPGEKIGAGAKELGKIENFTPGFTFRDAGGVTLWYSHDDPHYIEYDGCKMLTASSVAMIDSSYRLGITDEYRGILLMEGVTLEDFDED